MTDDKNKVALLPCPSCGGRAALSTFKKRIGTACKHTVIRQHAVCKVCGMQTKVFKALDRAHRSWNTRQPQTDALKMAREVAIDAALEKAKFLHSEIGRMGYGHLRTYAWEHVEQIAALKESK